MIYNKREEFQLFQRQVMVQMIFTFRKKVGGNFPPALQNKFDNLNYFHLLTETYSIICQISNYAQTTPLSQHCDK